MDKTVDDKRISVIIPVYNVQPYLEKCVKSVLAQTYSNLEILLIDDGSTDGSGQLCDRLKKLDTRIKVIHQENGGLSVARNTGLDFATGGWIAFLDSDDWIEPDMYAELYKLADMYGAELVSCAMCRCESEDTPLPRTDDQIMTFDEESIIKGLISNQTILFEVWNKLWKRSLIGNVRFVPNQVSEDVHFDRLLFSKVNRIVHTNKILHHYRINRPGNTNSTFKINRLCIFDEFDEWYHILKEKGRTDQASMIATVASQFAIHIFEEAVEKNQSHETKQKLIKQFRKFHERTNKCNYYYGSYRIKVPMMMISPAIYGRLWKTRMGKGA